MKDMPAFPTHHEEWSCGSPGFPSEKTLKFRPGMTLRDYHSAHAPEIPEWYRSYQLNIERNKADAEPAYQMCGELKLLARWKFDYADAMMEERSK